jgi:hypothetical protein
VGWRPDNPPGAAIRGLESSWNFSKASGTPTQASKRLNLKLQASDPATKSEVKSDTPEEFNYTLNLPIPLDRLIAGATYHAQKYF